MQCQAFIGIHNEDVVIRIARSYECECRCDRSGTPRSVIQVETEDRPFDGVSSDTKDREGEVWIAFGSTPEDHLTHGIPQATIIRVLPASGATGAVLEVESADGTRNIVYLTGPESYALPGDRRS